MTVRVFAIAIFPLIGLVFTGCGQTSSPVAAGTELTLDLGKGVTMKLVRIPAGTFTMGSPAGEVKRSSDEGPRHRVTLAKPFYMGINEVTQEQYQAVIGTNPSHFKGVKRPVENVSWNDASTFCRELAAKTGSSVRLPTEAEWEYACRAGTTTAYQWGNDPDDGNGWCNAADQTARQKFPHWTAFNWSDGYVYTAPVGHFKANAWGLYDMHGNVWEWCSNWYAEEYAARANAQDPTGPASGTHRILRGGSWSPYPKYCRSAYRRSGYPTWRRRYIGFRVVVSEACVD